MSNPYLVEPVTSRNVTAELRRRADIHRPHRLRLSKGAWLVVCGYVLGLITAIALLVTTS